MRIKQILSFFLIGFIISSCYKQKKLSTIDSPSGKESSLPRLFTDNTGTVFMSWVERNENMATLYFSQFSDNSWSEINQIQKSDDWFINWADYPSIIARNKAPMATHWLKKIPGNTYSYNVEISTFKNGAVSSPRVPHTDGTPTEHGFVSMIPVSDSSFYAIWLDGRNTTGGHGDHGDLSSAMSLRGAELSISGKTLSEAELDASVCDCCNTAIANTNSSLIAVYRNRTEDEIRDIYVSKYENGVWGIPKPVYNDNWKIAACPVNGPAIDSFDKTVAVGWFTGANNQAVVKLSFSLDAGESFSAPIVVDSTMALGRVDVIASKESAWISWMSRSGDNGLLHLKKIALNGTILEDFIITALNPSRGSGFPQITTTKKGLLVAWTDLSESGTTIKTVTIQ